MEKYPKTFSKRKSPSDSTLVLLPKPFSVSVSEKCPGTQQCPQQSLKCLQPIRQCVQTDMNILYTVRINASHRLRDACMKRSEE